jgi:hypothetical protein
VRTTTMRVDAVTDTLVHAAVGRKLVATRHDLS